MKYLDNCEYFDDTKHYRDNRWCYYTFFTYIYHKMLYKTTIWKRFIKNIRYDILAITLFCDHTNSNSLVRWTFSVFYRSTRPCISSSHCNKATPTFNNIWVQYKRFFSYIATKYQFPITFSNTVPLPHVVVTSNCLILTLSWRLALKC